MTMRQLISLLREPPQKSLEVAWERITFFLRKTSNLFIFNHGSTTNTSRRHVSSEFCFFTLYRLLDELFRFDSTFGFSLIFLRIWK
jgi:hypothetical protein